VKLLVYNFVSVLLLPITDAGCSIGDVLHTLGVVFADVGAIRRQPHSLLQSSALRRLRSDQTTPDSTRRDYLWCQEPTVKTVQPASIFLSSP